MSKQYGTVEELVADLHKKLPWWKDVYYYWYRKLYNIRDFFVLGIPTAWQRARRGWAKSDTWSLDYYLAKTISDSIDHLIENMHGFPANQDQFKTLDDWKEALENISWTFKQSIHCIEGKAVLPDQEYSNSMSDFFKKYDMRVLSEEEYKRYLKGWELFQKYFFSLWD